MQNNSLAGYDDKAKITTFNIYELAEKRTTDLFNSFRPVSSEEITGNPLIHSHIPAGIAVPKNHSALIARGSHALVFQLPNIFREWHWQGGGAQGHVYLIAKSSFYCELDAENYMLSGRPSGLGSGNLEQTIISLSSLGFSVPPMREIAIDIYGRTMYSTIAENLLQNRSRLEGADSFDFDQITNGEEIKEQYKLQVDRIMSAWQRKEILILPAGHGSEEDPAEAIKHLFLIQYGPGKNGNLLIGDLNHLSIKKN
ncbi:MAG: hypothetical protein Q8Q31_04430 [Nanoarchaeota archaeon]|nr:hypothetical protein [Nanoarchaeota archaeon]